MHQTQKIIAIKSTKLFNSIPTYLLLAIAQETEEVIIPAGEIIFLDNAPPTGLYIVASGIVDIKKNGKLLTKIKKHGYFGELALLDNSTRSASAIAHTKTSLLYIDKYIFDNLISNFPDLLKKIAILIMEYMD